MPGGRAHGDGMLILHRRPIPRRPALLAERRRAFLPLGRLALHPALVRQQRHLALVQQQPVGAKKRQLGRRDRPRRAGQDTASSTSASRASICSAGTTSCTRPMRSASSRVETLAGQRVAAGLAQPDRVDHVGRNRRRRDAHPHLGEAEAARPASPTPRRRSRRCPRRRRSMRHAPPRSSAWETRSAAASHRVVAIDAAIVLLRAVARQRGSAS